MKRSDMVNKMEGHWRGCQSFKSTEAMFSYILHRMEEVGMLPPRAEFWTTDIYDKPFCNIKNKWEEEAPSDSAIRSIRHSERDTGGNE